MSTVSQVSPRVKRTIFGTTGLAFCGVLVETSLNVTFPTLMRQFHVSLNAIQWVTTAYLLAVAVTMVIAGYIQRNVRLKTIITVGGGAFVLGGLLCALAPNLPLLIVGRVIQALGTGLTMPLVFSLIMTNVPLASQGKFTGTAGMLIALAPSLGPTYGGFVTQLWTWQLVFWITLPLGIIAGLVALTNAEQNAKIQGEAFPATQFILIVASLILLALGFNSAGQTGFLAPQFYGSVAAALVLLFFFVKVSNRAQTPLLNLQIFKQSAFVRALLIYFTIQFIQIGLTFVLPNFAQLALGKNALISGLILLAGSLVSAVLSPLSGKFLDTVGIQQPLRIGSLFLVGSLAYFALFAKHLTLILLAVFYLLYMIGFSLMFNNSLTFGLQSLQPATIGDGNAIFNTLQQYAGSLGTAIMAALLGLGGQLHPTASVVTQTISGNQIALWVSLVIIVLVACLAWTVRAPKKQK